jgi:hypothetical protein
MSGNLIKLRRGDHFSYAVAVAVDGVALNTTGWAIAAEAVRQGSSVTPAQTITASWVDAAQGLGKLSLTDVQTAGLAAGEWQMQIRLTTPEGLKSSSEPTVIEVRS